MGGANGSRECAPDDELRDTHHVRNDGDGFRAGLNPSFCAQICLTDKSLRVLPVCLSSPICKNISVFAWPKSDAYPSRPVPTEGRFAIVTNAGRDAVDARASGAQAVAGRDEPRERSASVQDDRRLSGRQSRVVLAPVAGVKSVEVRRPDRALYKPLIRG